MKEVKTPRKPLAIYYAIVLLMLLLLNFVLLPWMEERQIKEVDYGTFMTMTEEKNIGRVDIESNQIIFTDKDETQVYKTGLMNDTGLTERLYDAGATFSSEIVEQSSPVLSFLIWFVLPIILFSAIGNQMNKKLMEKAGGGPGSMMFGGMGKSNAKVYVQSTHGIRFADVAGEDEAKENLQEIVNYLHDPKQYEEIGASMPKGILLVGPPGTGKTMLAKAVAGESNVPFFSISGSEFVEMFVGMGASKVRDLFKQAKEKAPCIVFIDEIDAIGQKRSGGQYGGNDEREQTLNQLLTEMDGFEGNTGVIILAATNRPESLDPALTRPGRFDRRVPVELPDLKGREEILKVHAKKVALAPGIDFTTVARMASGASGAELANIVNEAALRAVRAGRKSVTQSDLEESIEVREYDIGPGELEYCISFRLPEHSGPEEEWNLHIAGRAETEELLRAHLYDLAAAGAEVVGEAGYSYPVTASLVHDYWFPTKTYTDFALPAGAYTALRIEIGAGGGQNWWCVVFPPLCLGSVSETTQETALEAGLTENQVSLMTGEDEGYVVKFKAVELLEQFKGWLEGR